MSTKPQTSASAYPVNGYDFVRTIINLSGNEAVETLLVAAHSGETDWLEKKAGVYPSVEKDPAFREKLEKCPPEKIAEETRFYEAEILRATACAVVALHNSRGGVLFVGIDDSNNPVPFESCDPNGILERSGLEAYVRQAIVDRLFPDNGEFRCKKATWTLPNIDWGVEARICSFRDTAVVALLVPSLEPGSPPVLVTKTENNRPRKVLLKRNPGDIGSVRKETVEETWNGSAATLSGFHDIREHIFLSNTDLFAKLSDLGIDPPPPKPVSRPGMSVSKTKKRRFAIAASVLVALSVLVLLVRRGTPREPDPLDPLREGLRTGRITMLSPEQAQKQVDNVQQSLDRSTHGVLSDLGKLKAENRKSSDRSKRWRLWRDAESVLEQATETALWNSGVLCGAVDSSSVVWKNVRHFREDLSDFDDRRRTAERSRDSRLGFGENNTESALDELLEEIKSQTDELISLLEKMPVIDAADENEWSRNGRRAEMSMSAIRALCESLRKPIVRETSPD